MIDPHLLTRKLERIEQFLREMETADAPVTFDEFSSNTVFNCSHPQRNMVFTLGEWLTKDCPNKPLVQV